MSNRPQCEPSVCLAGGLSHVCQQLGYERARLQDSALDYPMSREALLRMIGDMHDTATNALDEARRADITPGTT